MATSTTTTLLQLSMPTDPAIQYIVLGFAAFALVYVTLIRPHRKKKKDPLERSPAMSSLTQHRSVERDMSNLLVELSDMARQMTAQLDTRAAKLEVLIKEADDRIAMLKRASVGITTLPPDEKSETPPTFFEPSVEDAPPAPPPPPDPRHAAVYELADQGQSVADIAQELGRPTGEVELILALRGGG